MVADQAGIDLAPLAGGSGPEGRIVKADVERLIAGGGVAAPPAPAPAVEAGAGCPRGGAGHRRRGA